MALERELEECHRELEEVRPPVPALPAELETGRREDVGQIRSVLGEKEKSNRMDSLGGVRSLTELQGSVYGSAVNGGSRMGSSNGMGSLNGMNSSNTMGSSNGMNSSNTMTSPNTMTPMNAATPMNPMDDASNADYAPQDAYPMEEDFASPLTDVLQQMIASPETFNVDTIDDVSFPGRRRDWL